MPTSNKRKPTRQLYRSKKRFRKSTTISNYRKARFTNLKNQVYFFKRNAGLFTYSGNALNNPLIVAQAFSFQQLAGSGEFTSLFDQYMITHVQLKFFLRIDPSAQSASLANIPRLYWFTDHDDDTAPPNLNAFREHQRLKITPMSLYKPVTINVKPSILSQVYRTISTTGYAPKWHTWIDCAQIDVPHYGLKWAIDDLTNTNYRVDVETVFWFRTRAPR